MDIKLLEPDAYRRWDAFVEAHGDATFFHRAGWQEVLKKAFGFPTYFLYAEQDGDITGILPLAQVKSWLFGNALVSTPFCVYGGVVSRDEASKQALVKAACEHAEALQVDYLELRHRQQQLPDWPHKDLYVTFRKSISSDPDENLKAIPRKQRAVVRKAIAQALPTRNDQQIDDFYHAYSSSVRNLGTPVYSRKYFRTLLEVFPDETDILTITHEEAVVTSVMSFYFKDEVLPYYGGGTALARKLKGNDYMYWQLMNQAVDRGVRTFDYGRSKQGTGAFSFKKNWGFEPESLYYEYYLVKAAAMPDMSPLNPKYQLMIKTWQKLPLWLSQLIGPMVSRYLG